MHVQGFPIGVGWWGDILAKMGKNYMKMKKSAFFCVIIVGGKVITLLPVFPPTIMGNPDVYLHQSMYNCLTLIQY